MGPWQMSVFADRTETRKPPAAVPSRRLCFGRQHPAGLIWGVEGPQLEAVQSCRTPRVRTGAAAAGALWKAPGDCTHL